MVIEREASNLVEHILANSGREMKMEMFTFAVPVLNVLWEMVAGHAFKREDKKLRRILDLMNWVFVSKIFGIAMLAPWVRFIFPSLTGYNKVTANNNNNNNNNNDNNRIQQGGCK